MNEQNNNPKQYLQLERKVTVAVSDTDFNAQIKPSAIMGYCQDIATEHADILGIGYDDIRAQNSVWVMIRMSFKILQSPKVGETLLIRTLPEKPKSADVNRGYYIMNGAGETVIAASSKWCVLDLDTHRIKRCSSVFEKFGDFGYIPVPPFEDANYKLKQLSDYGEITGEPLTHTVQVTDLDYNIHMNNARYGDIILNICGMDIMREYAVSRVDINFMSQLFVGESFTVNKVQSENITYIEAKKSDRETIVFRGRVEWNKK